jgi:hypothetical protein
MPVRGTPDSEWVVLANRFPATLNRDAAPESLQENETPDSFGLGLDRPGWLYYDSAPSSGTAWTGINTVSAPTYAPTTCTWRYCFNRLFGFPATGATVYYGAMNYLDTYLLQGLGYIPVDDNNETSNITNIIPISGGNVAVFKSDFCYIIRNSDSPGGSLTAEFLKQATGLPTAASVIVLDNTMVFANTHGVFAFNGQNITELTLPVRSSLAPFNNTVATSLKADFEKRRIIGFASATKFIIDLNDKPMLYDYSTAGFRFTSKTLVAEDASPLLIDKLMLVYQYSASDYATINIDIKQNDAWKTESQFTIRPQNDNGMAMLSLNNVLACRKFAIRITAMSESLYINSILCHVKTGGVLGYSNK